MSERPNALLTVVLGLAGAAGLLLLIGVAALAAGGVDVLAATLVAAFSACLLFLAGAEGVPLPAIVVVALAAASTIAFARTAAAAIREARLLRALPLRPVADAELTRVARASGLESVYSTPAAQPSAFCIGIVRPRVVLTDGLLTRLDADERAAVVWHEAAHALAREPLKCLLARLAARTFFWLPLLGELLERYLLAKELDADRRATTRTSRSALAGALAQVAGRGTPAAAVGFADLSAARIDRLFDPAAPLPRLFRPRSVVLTLAAMTALGLALASQPAPAAIETEQIWSMLVSDSALHGLPAMLAGLVVNLLALALAARFVRRIREREGGAKPIAP